ncbi:MAG: nuclear transport factor 2 family protein [Thermosynechococcaceae cyanobacterium]
MSETIIERLFQSVANGNIDSAVAMTTPDVIFEAQGPSEIPIYNIFKGHEGVRLFFSTLGDLFDTEAFEVRSSISDSSSAFAYGYMQHRVKRSGLVFRSDWALYCVLPLGMTTNL